ncbi:hypothetical protein D1007_48669 [Hordeum vulgare]|nr:hypothetical protein D1007_48669 [Hordeum vulgare]
MSATGSSPSPLPSVRAPPSSGEAAAALRFSGEAPRHLRHGRPSAIVSSPAVVVLWVASGHPETTLGRGEGSPTPSARRPALPRPPVAGWPATDLLCRNGERKKKASGREERRGERKRGGPRV